MRVGGLSSVYPAYVYNPGVVSSKSMNKLSRISDDVLDKKVGYSGVESKQENQNPLKKGQTVDFEGLLAKQMQQGRSRAAKVMPEGLNPIENKEENVAAKSKTENMSVKSKKDNVRETVSNEKDFVSDNADNFNPSQMQRAIQAYEMFMIA